MTDQVFTLLFNELEGILFKKYTFSLRRYKFYVLRTEFMYISPGMTKPLKTDHQLVL